MPELQISLAALATLEVQHEIGLDYLEAWSGPRAVKQSLLAEHERAYQQARVVCLQRLTRLQARGRADGPPISPAKRQGP